MKLESIAPHDFHLSLDATDRLGHPGTEDEVAEHGMPCPLTLSTRDVFAVARFEGDPEVDPHFDVSFPGQDAPTGDEEVEVREALGRTLGTGLDNTTFYEAIAEDPVLGPLCAYHRGYKRLSGASVYEDAVRGIVFNQIAHAGARQAMLRGVQQRWGSSFEWRGRTYATTPRPGQWRDAEAKLFKEYKVSVRKGEYVTGLAKLIDDGDVDVAELESMDAVALYERLTAIRGIGPTTAQLLLLGRHRPDAALIPVEHKGEERGMLRFILPLYGVDPDDTSEEDVAEVLCSWEGVEARACQLLYLEMRMAKLEGRATA